MFTTRRLHALLTTATVTAIAVTAFVTSVPAAEAKPASITTSYVCGSPFGNQVVSGTSTVNLPAKVRSGTKLAERPVRIRMVLPAAIVSAMRDILGITAISGKATGASYTVGNKLVPLTNLVLPRTPLPARGPVTLNATGVAKGFRLTRAGTYAVKVPTSFRLYAYNQAGQAIPGSPLSCTLASGAPSKLGTITVVD